MAGQASRGGVAGRAGQPGEFPRRGGGRAGPVAAAAGQRFQGSACAQRHRPDADGSRRGATMNTMVTGGAIGRPLDRVDGPLKVTGTARYAFEQPVDRPAYMFPLQATIAAGRIIAVEASAATAEPGVLAVLTHKNAPRLAWTGDPEVAVLHSDQVAFRGQLVGAVVAETSEIARHAAGLVKLDYQERAADAVLGDVEAGLASAAIRLGQTYTTPMCHHNPMEPHTAVASWADEMLT